MKRCIQIFICFIAVLILYMASYAQGVEQAKSQAEALFQKGLDYYDAGDYDKAVETYTKVITLDARHW